MSKPKWEFKGNRPVCSATLKAVGVDVMGGANNKVVVTLDMDMDNLIALLKKTKGGGSLHLVFTEDLYEMVWDED